MQKICRPAGKAKFFLGENLRLGQGTRFIDSQSGRELIADGDKGATLLNEI